MTNAEKNNVYPEFFVSQKDRPIIRNLAKQVAEFAADPIQQEKADLWFKHNDLERVSPRILVFPEGAWREMIPDNTLYCEGAFARQQELELRKAIYYGTDLQDDNVIENSIETPLYFSTTGIGFEQHKTDSAEQLGSYHIDPVLVELSDAKKLQIPEAIVNWEKTERHQEVMQDLLGDLLQVRRSSANCRHIAPLDEYALLRGIDNMFLDLMDEPEFVHEVVSKLIDGKIAIAKSLEKQGALTLTLGRDYSGSGGTCYTKQLPQKDFDGEHVRLKDVWGFSTDQIFCDVSPAMHDEFAIQHEKRFLELFGLNSYGCCEPLHNKLDLLFENIPNLRRISISPWADVDICAEKLGADYIYSRKPNPAPLAGETFNEAAIRADLVDFFEKTKGNVVEVIMKDTHTIRNEPQRIKRWLQIAKELAST